MPQHDIATGLIQNPFPLQLRSLLEKMKVALLANPASGRGAGARALPAAQAALSRLAPVYSACTIAPGDETRIVREALHAGAETIAVLGGDGTWSNTARALLEAGAGDRCRLAFLAAGTGNDLAKSLKIPAHDFAATARLIESRSERRMDAGQVNGRWFVNAVGFGFDAAVLEQTLQPSALRGVAVYIAAAARELFRYRGFTVRIGDAREQRLLMLVFANGAYFGGAFHIAPSAQLDSGTLSVVTIRDATPIQRIRLFAAATRGSHIALPGVSLGSVRDCHLTFQSPVVYQADGELLWLATGDVDVRCVPGALRICA